MYRLMRLGSCHEIVRLTGDGSVSHQGELLFFPMSDRAEIEQSRWYRTLEDEITSKQPVTKLREYVNAPITVGEPRSIVLTALSWSF